MVTALYFDLDGTLIDSLPCCVVTTQEVFRTHGFTPPPDEDVRGKVGIPIEVAFPEFTGEAPDSGIVASMIAEYREAYLRNMPGHSRLCDGVSEMLDTARRIIKNNDSSPYIRHLTLDRFL